MPQIFARVELRGCKQGAPYEKLHDLMVKWGWSRTIKTPEGRITLLPNDVYVADSDRTPEELATGIRTDVELYIWKPSMVFVAESTTWSVSPNSASLIS